MHWAALPSSRLMSECEVTRTRRGGPGGQHRNKVSTAVVLVHLPTGVSAQASEQRSQAANLAVAEHRLRLNLALAVRSPIDSGATVSERWTQRVVGERIRVSPEHPDFPALLAEALDAISAHGFAIPAAAGWLKVTPSQLLRLLRSEPAAWTWLNRNRQQAGLGPLK